jgi:hypothetical protein
MAAAAPTREDTWLLTVNVDGRDLGVFDTLSGGELDSEESKYQPGGMAAEISLGGRKTIGNVTIGRYCDRTRAARITIGQTPLDPMGARAGEPLTYTGTLKTVTPPDVDSTGTDAAQLTLEATIDGTA